MKHVSIFLDDNDFEKLAKFIKSLGSAHVKASRVVEHEDEGFFIPQWQQDLVKHRIKNSKPEDYSSIEGLDKEINLQK
ncbi:MAG: hypothetical protein WD048_04545 [Chitinophagales bacterium]